MRAAHDRGRAEAVSIVLFEEVFAQDGIIHTGQFDCELEDRGARSDKSSGNELLGWIVGGKDVSIQCGSDRLYEL